MEAEFAALNKRLFDRTADGSCNWKEAQLPRLEDFLAQAGAKNR